MPLSYIGGKSLISKSLIIPNIPKDIETYVEPFSGMMWTFFRMDLVNYPNLSKIVYNDFNKLNSNLFHCLMDQDRLLRECEKIPVQRKGVSPTPSECREFFERSQSEVFSDISTIDCPNYEIAAKYALVLTNVFSGSRPDKSKFIDLKGKYHSKFTSFMNKLKNQNWIDHFRSITDIENMDFGEVIKKYDSTSSYFYCDPPYFKTEDYYANHEFGIDTHKRLADTLVGIKGKFSLSYYDFPELSEWFPKSHFRWVEAEFNKPAMARRGKSQTKSTEILIMNY